MISEAIDTVNKLFRAMYSALGLIIICVLGVLLGKWSSCDSRPVPAVVQPDWATYEKDMKRLGVVLEENGLYKEENRNLNMTIRKLTGLLKEGHATGRIISAPPLPTITYDRREVVGGFDTMRVFYNAPDLDLPIAGILSPTELRLVAWNPMWEARAAAPVRKIYSFPREADNFAFSLRERPQIYNYDGIVVQWYSPFAAWRGLYGGVEYGLPRGLSVYLEARARVWWIETSVGVTSLPQIYGRISYEF